MTVIWKRHNKHYYNGSQGYDLIVNGVRNGVVVPIWGSMYKPVSVMYRVIHQGKHYPRLYNTLSGARMRLEQLLGVETDWCKKFRSRFPPPLTPQEQTWAILNAQY